MATWELRCKECDTVYPPEARYVCENCFGPLEVSYDFSALDPEEARRKIQAGSPGIWRYRTSCLSMIRPGHPSSPG